jgi:hypothetical protein
MIVATLIMSIAVVGLLSGIAGATRNAVRLRDYDRVVQVARLRMNDLLTDESLAPGTQVGGEFDPQKFGGMEGGWQARLSDFERPPSPGPGQLILERIELQIWWMAGKQRRTFTLDAYRRRIMTPEEAAQAVAAAAAAAEASK